MTKQLLINLTTVLTERDADKGLPITIRKKMSRVLLCFFGIHSQMNITIKHTDKLTSKYERQQAVQCSKTVQTLFIQELAVILHVCSLLLPNIAC